MQLKSDLIIFDTSCLILLTKIDELALLKKFQVKVCITSTIKHEFNKPLPGWIKVIDPEDKHYQKILKLDLDAGEASAIALSLEKENAILIIDDLKARKLAEKLNLRYSGTFGLLLKAKQLGLIDSVKPILDKVERTNFRFSHNLIQEILKQSGEDK